VVSGELRISAVPTWRSPLRRIEWLLDGSAIAQAGPTTYVRRALGSLFLLYGVVLAVLQYTRDDINPKPVFIIVFSAFLFTNRLGSFIRYFVPIGLAIYAYAAASGYSALLSLGIHYKPQIEIDRALTLGHGLPTVWLQQHLYHGHTGPLEGIAVLAYAGHFLVPFIVVAALILTRKFKSIQLLVFSLMTAALLADVVFVLAPTAPPWLAEQHGYITGVHHILKQSLADMHMSTLARVEGDGTKYDVTAAMPSLHTAFALLVFLVARRARMSRFTLAALAFNAVAVVFSIVYTGEHYVSDVLAGGLLTALAWWLVLKLSARRAAGEAAAAAPQAA
jgi:membrane-associated phospholipid phosphatase